MIKKMRIKIVVVAMTALIILLSAIFITINIFMGQIALQDTDAFLESITYNNGKLIESEHIVGRPDGPPSQIQMIKGVSLKVTSEGEISEVIFNDEKMPMADIDEIVNKIINNKDFVGTIEGYRYRVKKIEYGYIVVFADTVVQEGMLEKLLSLSIGIGFLSVGVLFILITILSRYITKPVEVAFQKQKRFISDSSHELKTPLSIISANLDMLEIEKGKSNRTSAMSEGIKRMSNLIQDLLLLARTEQKNYTFLSFNLSNIMESTILPLEVIAYEQGNRIETTIEENIMFKGYEEGLRKMIGALMENAIKYSKKDSIIKASLHTKGDIKIIEMFNEGIGVTKEQKDKIFDKFYRADASRNGETGGHGIGLSIVKNIVDMHKGKIHVESIPNEYIVFKITLRG
ncbi:sensor histidine kinase [Clostridium sp. DL1XJH146]